MQANAAVVVEWVCGTLHTDATGENQTCQGGRGREGQVFDWSGPVLTGSINTSMLFAEVRLLIRSIMLSFDTNCMLLASGDKLQLGTLPPYIYIYIKHHYIHSIK